MRALTLMALALTASACAVGPNYKAPAVPKATRYTAQPLTTTTGAATRGGQAQRFWYGSDIPGRWWTLFQSPELDELVDEAVRNSPDLQSAQAALRQARELVRVQRGSYLPQVDASADVARQRTSASLAPLLNNNALSFTLYNAQVQVGYTPDVFGSVRRQVENAAAQAEAQRFQAEATYLTLTANVATAALQAASLKDQMTATERTSANERQWLEILRKQNTFGQVSGVDVAAQESALAQAEQALPPLRKQLAQQQDLLATLTGRSPDHPGLALPSLAAVQLPTTLPVSLPSQLVRQRPDIRAAEANLHAASAAIGVAAAARLPSIALTASAGGTSPYLAQLLSQGNWFYSLGAGVLQPVFHGGALRHRQRAAEAAFDQSKAQYRSTVLNAFQNVADTLHALEQDAGSLVAAVNAEHAATKSLTLARAQFRFGQSSATAVLNAEQAWNQAEANLAQARAARFTDTVALFQALGGGWWNRTAQPNGSGSP